MDWIGSLGGGHTVYPRFPEQEKVVSGARWWRSGRTERAACDGLQSKAQIARQEWPGCEPRHACPVGVKVMDSIAPTLAATLVRPTGVLRTAAPHD